MEDDGKRVVDPSGSPFRRRGDRQQVPASRRSSVRGGMSVVYRGHICSSISPSH